MRRRPRAEEQGTRWTPATRLSSTFSRTGPTGSNMTRYAIVGRINTYSSTAAISCRPIFPSPLLVGFFTRNRIHIRIPPSGRHTYRLITTTAGEGSRLGRFHRYMILHTFQSRAAVVEFTSSRTWSQWCVTTLGDFGAAVFLPFFAGVIRHTLWRKNMNVFLTTY